MESLVEPLGFTKQASVGDSPWSQILGQPAHLTSEFGIRKDPFTRRWVQHEGLDLAAPEGTTVTPMRAGEVVYSGWQSGYGKMVIVRHDDGLETVYGHGSKLLVRAGERVTEDTPLAEVGSTGRSTGSHLHFEVRKDGSAVDPVPYLTAKGM
ncbi:MAG: M23 family metallopeptidase [FCB group bacterium]|nr:M23 family metallopeptidase [FCB group bacterium]